MLSELLGLDGYSVKQVNEENTKLIITEASDNLPVCPECKQTLLSSPKDVRHQTVENLSVFEKDVF